MKYVIMVMFCLLVTGNTKAQSFSINTDGSAADNSAILDVKSTNRGMLIPRMTKAQRNVIAAPATGLLVFQLSPDSTGFYYFNGTAWIWLPGNDVLDTLSWKRHGNIATNPAIHFIGTVDDQPLSFRQNNTWLGRWNGTRNNYFIGDSAGAKVTTGMFNIGIGDSALFNLSSGSRNIAIGNAVLPKINSVSGLISIGDSSGYNNIFGDKNIYIGSKAGYANVSGTTNILIGTNAGKNMIAGEGNVFIGDSTGASMTSAGATSSVFIGDKAGSKTIVEANTFIGNYAGRLNINGESNTFLGTASGTNNESGSFNTILGELAGYDNISGHRNTFTGYLAGSNNTANDNVFLGYRAAITNTTGSGNTTIGSDANLLKNNLNNASAIGYRAAVDTSNALVLGSITGINGATSHTKVGIGTTKPLALLHVQDSSVLFRGPGTLPATPANPPVSGAGNRMMWYSEKAAFRAGGAFADEWDNLNVGPYSATLGFGNKAFNYASMAFGYGNDSGGFASFVAGGENTVSGNYTSALGHNNTVTGERSAAIGYSNIISGAFSNAIGVQNTVDGISAHAIGSANISSGVVSLALGNFTRAIGDRSTTMGYNTRAKSFGSVVIGQYNDTTSTNSINWEPTDPVFVIGNGLSPAARRNAFIITKEGQTGINIATGLPQALLHLKAKEASYNMHIRLENLGNTDYASMVYDGSMKFRTFGADDEYQWRNAANSTTLRLTNDGELGINVAVPQALLDAGGTFKLGTNGTVNNAIIRDTISLGNLLIGANGSTEMINFIANIVSGGIVSVSPSADLPDGIVIAWARAQTGAIKIHFRNVTGAAINVPAMDYYYCVVQ